MSTKDEYLAKLKTQLDRWQVEVDELQVKANEATGDIRAEIDEQIANLRVKFAEGETKFDEIADATEEAWEELKVEAEAKFNSLAGEVKEEAKEAIAGVQGICAKIKSFFS